MSQNSSEKYLYFTVGLLKGSATLEALRRDATKHHMIDNPGQLIALRLTEYYEMIDQGTTQPAVHAATTKTSPETETPAGDHEPMTETQALQRAVPGSFPSPAAPLTNGQPQPAPTGQSPNRLPADTRVPSTSHSEPTSVLSQITGKMRTLRIENESVISVSSAAEQNADEAADYWSTL